MARSEGNAELARRSAVGWLLVIHVTGLLLASLWFRCAWLNNTPGLNGDEAWYGVQALELLRGEDFQIETPTGNPPNLLFFGPLLLLHAFFPPSIALLRAVAVGSGVAALVINWVCCRWVFDRRTAVISTVVLAILPINIAYSRFAWDASQSVAITLPVLYLSLASIRFAGRRGRFLLAAVLMQWIACLVHPTNVFVAPAVVVALAVWVREGGVRKATRGVSPRTKAAVLVLGILAAVLLGLLWLSTPGSSRFLGRLHSPTQLAQMETLARLTVLLPRLFLGATVYRYIAGVDSWLSWPAAVGSDGWGADTVLFWAVMAACVWTLCRAKDEPVRRTSRTLLCMVALQLAAFALLAGPHGLSPGWERYAICLVGPIVVLLARGAAVSFSAGSPRWRLALVVGSLCGWLMLADFREHYFHCIHQTGGRAHPTFRTSDEDPKASALKTILANRQPGVAWIVTGEWHIYWPIRYFGMSEDELRVVTPKEVAASEEFDQAQREGRVWYVEFADALPQTTATGPWPPADLPSGKLRRWKCLGYDGRPVLEILHDK